jgi:FkbM family methyltransferase
MIDPSRMFPYTCLLGKILRLPLRLIPKDHITSIKFGLLRGNKWIVDSGVHGYWLGTFESDKQEFLGKHLRSNTVVYDIGAHVGFYSMLASKLVGPRGKVYAFEPVSRNVAYLRRHLEANSVENVTTLNCALADSPGYAKFELGSDSSGGRLGKHGQIQVEVHSLDELLREHIIEPAQFVKIDAEGAELSILCGGAHYFREHGPLILLATHNESIHRSCCELLQSWRYSVGPLRKSHSLGDTDEIFAEKKN